MKAILVIDMPKNCAECPCVNDEFGFCRADEKIRDCDWHKTPTWCPLMPMPDKKPVSYHDDLFGDVEKNFTNIGWNLCLDEITEKQNESNTVSRNR